ncbi:ER membrane protein complex subunit 7 [Tolypocladium ophioglossoides CBS 100239]|uniref:ER membrane protein complex subunit 7 n=1 Tax=Tolypocladium ophioglossoides (strain CBS 100239) TaxID=1163406 RepID=A0A0L0NKI3_TOLOC|nr:ER membrane protein complex subunit 7 [Tolypocladium ophioglossoides CBS 100239]
MRLSLALLPALASLALSTTTTTLTLSLPASPNPFALPASTHATLASLGAHHAAPLSAINTFVFRNVTPGSYLADVHCATDAFRPLRVDVAADGGVRAWETFRGNEWGNRGEALEVKDGRVVEVRAVGKKNYFMERPKFSALSILKNPMILMGLVSMVIFIGMPYIMENMDPEMKAEFEAQQAKGGLAGMIGGAAGGQQGGNPLGEFDMASFLAGSSKKGGGKNGGDGGGDGAVKNHGVRR